VHSRQLARKGKTMKRITYQISLGLFLAVIASPTVLRAHCDTLEGPVISTAREALDKGNVTPVLKWVKAADEAAVRAAFDKTAAVRKQSPEAAALADTWFFETLVRIHRAGEGAPYTGLKSGGVEEPGIAAADHAMASGKFDEVLAETVHPLEATLKAKFERVMALKPHADHNVEAGREYVEAYVDYVHFADRLATLAAGAATSEHAEHGH